MLLFLILACKSPEIAKPSTQAMVEYHPTDNQYPQVQSNFPTIEWDEGLVQAAQEVISTVRTPEQIIPVSSMLLASKRAGYPGQVSFVKVLNGGGFPLESLNQISNRDVDLGVSKRSFADGRVLWLITWGRKLVSIDPVPQTIPLDGSFPLRIGEFKADKALLYISAPDQPIDIIELLPNAHRWLQNFHTPGEYIFEVVLQTQQGSTFQNEIALLFSVFVDQEIPTIQRVSISPDVPNPIEAEHLLFQEVNKLRSERGLHLLKPFDIFVPLAREHSALMASKGVVAHTIPGLTNGVPENAARLAHPRANHFQNVAAALSPEEALYLAINSPGHLQVFLCEPCTHMSVGAAIEPTLGQQPRLFITWEVLEFTRGVPTKIERLNRVP